MQIIILNPNDAIVPDPYNPNPLAADFEVVSGLLPPPVLPVTVEIAPPLPVGACPFGI
jgi:hypothetical protein